MPAISAAAGESQVHNGHEVASSNSPAAQDDGFGQMGSSSALVVGQTSASESQSGHDASKAPRKDDTLDTSKVPPSVDSNERELSSADANNVDKPEKGVDHERQGEQNDGWVHLDNEGSTRNLSLSP